MIMPSKLSENIIVHLLSLLCAFHPQGAKVAQLKSNECSQLGWTKTKVYQNR